MVIFFYMKLLFTYFFRMIIYFIDFFEIMQSRIFVDIIETKSFLQLFAKGY